MQIKRAFVWMFAAVTLSVSGLAQSIFVTNNDFTADDYGSGFTYSPSPPTGWNLSATSGEDSAGTISASGLSDHITAPDGITDYAYINSTGDSPIVYQDLSTTFVSGQQYVLTALVGVRSDDSGGAGKILLEDSSSNILGTSSTVVDNSVGGAPSTFEQVSVTYTATAGEADQVIRIVLDNATPPSGAQVEFTDVTLTAVPEPRTSALWLGAAALGAIGIVRARRIGLPRAIV